MIWSLKPLDAAKVFLLIFCWLQLSSWKQNKIVQLDLKANWGVSPLLFAYFCSFFGEVYLYIYLQFISSLPLQSMKNHTHNKNIYIQLKIA